MVVTGLQRLKYLDIQLCRTIMAKAKGDQAQKSSVVVVMLTYSQRTQETEARTTFETPPNGEL